MEFKVVKEVAAEMPTHVHQFSRCDRQMDLTTPQLRKLAFYRGEVELCQCGVMKIDVYMQSKMYSRNGSRV